VQIGIANKCNHRCVMCWDHPSLPPAAGDSSRALPAIVADRSALLQQHNFMDLEMLNSLADDLKALGTRRIELAGRGEPMLHPKFDEIVKTLKDRGFSVGVVTNGSLLSSEKCEFLVRAGLDRLVLSLNAGCRETYPRIHTTASPEVYDTIVERIREFRGIRDSRNARFPQIMVSYVICRPNRLEGLEMIERAKDLRADQLVFKYAMPYPGIESVELTDGEKQEFSRQIPELLSRAESYGIDVKLEPPISELAGDAREIDRKLTTVYSQIPCYIGWLFCLVTAEGNVSPCCQCDEPVGDLRKQRFRDIWNCDSYVEFRRRMKRLPVEGLGGVRCTCDQCAFEKNNTTVHNLLHFYRRAHLHDGQREFGLRDLLPAIFNGRATRRGASPRRRRPKRGTP